jgi:hypothetical protein
MQRLMVMMLIIVGVWGMALSQDGPKAAPGTAYKRACPGRVLEVDQRRQQARLVLYLRVESPDAPGKIPDEMAQQAAHLTAQMQQLEQAGRAVDVARMRAHINELLRWREVELKVTAGDTTPLVTMRRLPISQLAIGDRLRLNVMVDGELSPQVWPTRGLLVKDAMQIGNRIPYMVKRLPAPPRLRSTFFEMVGDVVNLNPLVMQVGQQTIQLQVSQQVGVLQQIPISVRDLQPGARVTAMVRMKGPLEIAEINRVLVIPPNTDTAQLPLEELD